MSKAKEIFKNSPMQIANGGPLTKGNDFWLNKIAEPQKTSKLGLYLLPPRRKPADQPVLEVAWKNKRSWDTSALSE